MDAVPQSQVSRIFRGLPAEAVRNRNFLFGIFFLLTVAFLWTASNFVTQVCCYGLPSVPADEIVAGSV